MKERVDRSSEQGAVIECRSVQTRRRVGVDAKDDGAASSATDAERAIWSSAERNVRTIIIVIMN